MRQIRQEMIDKSDKCLSKLYEFQTKIDSYVVSRNFKF